MAPSLRVFVVLALESSMRSTFTTEKRPLNRLNSPFPTAPIAISLKKNNKRARMRLGVEWAFYNEQNRGGALGFGMRTSAK